MLPSAILCCSGLEPDGTRRERPSAHVGWSGYWFEPGQQIKQESPGRSPEDSCFIRSPDWTRTSNPSINSRMLCQLSYGGLFCFRCRFPLQRVITIPGLFGLRNLKYREVYHSLDWGWCCLLLTGGAPRQHAERRAFDRLPERPQGIVLSRAVRQAGGGASPARGADAVPLRTLRRRGLR